MADHFSMEQAREQLARNTGIPGDELIHCGVSQNGDFTRHHFYRKNVRTIEYTVFSQEEVDYLEETGIIDYAP